MSKTDLTGEGTAWQWQHSLGCSGGGPLTSAEPHLGPGQGSVPGWQAVCSQLPAGPACTERSDMGTASASASHCDLCQWLWECGFVALAFHFLALSLHRCLHYMTRTQAGWDAVRLHLPNSLPIQLPTLKRATAWPTCLEFRCCCSALTHLHLPAHFSCCPFISGLLVTRWFIRRHQLP